MEAALELDDDVFFADLSKQISLLIMDDDDEGDSFSRHFPSANLQGFSNTFHPPLQASYLAYDHQLASRRESKGTGVFIPRSSHRRRRSNNKNNRQGNYTASANKFMRLPSDQNSREFITPQMNYYNINASPSYDQSFNLRRF